MKIFRIVLICFVILSTLSCSRKSDENTILLADREAPLGWIYLKIYDDKTFEYISKGLIIDDVYPGTVKISHDTIYFKYSEETPNQGKIAVINKRYIQYLDSSQFIEIKRNKIKNQ